MIRRRGGAGAGRGEEKDGWEEERGAEMAKSMGKRSERQEDGGGRGRRGREEEGGGINSQEKERTKKQSWGI